MFISPQYFHMFSHSSERYLNVPKNIFMYFQVAPLSICMYFHKPLQCIWNALRWFMRVFTWLCVVFICLHSISMYFHAVLRCICKSPKTFLYMSVWLCAIFTCIFMSLCGDLEGPALIYACFHTALRSIPMCTPIFPFLFVWCCKVFARIHCCVFA